MDRKQTRVGLIGLGAIGEHYRDNLLRAFPDLLVFDHDAAKVAAAVGAGAEAAESQAALGEACDIVVASLPNPQAVRSAIGAEDGLLSLARPGTVVLDTSTVSPQTSRDMHELARQRQVHYLDAPVSGGQPMEAGVAGAAAGTMTFMVGGDEEAYELAKPAMEALGSFSFLLGPSGSGSVVKLISNLCSGTYLHVAAEALALGHACGFTTEQLMEVFAHTDAKCYIMTDYLVPRMLRGDVKPGFTVELQLKDHRLAAELGHESKVGLPFNGLAIQQWELLRAQGRGERDITETGFFAAEMTGRPYDVVTEVD
ncbi:MAG: NAD(P)-dependent oxidoreductase [Actinobacteria bacterium]|nr:NAD(P)-dependent oxidoreductase [Actinomycetota bacterium]